MLTDPSNLKHLWDPVAIVIDVLAFLFVATDLWGKENLDRVVGPIYERLARFAAWFSRGDDSALGRAGSQIGSALLLIAAIIAGSLSKLPSWWTVWVPACVVSLALSFLVREKSTIWATLLFSMLLSGCALLVISIVGLFFLPRVEVSDWAGGVLWRGLAVMFVATPLGSLVLGASIRFIYPTLSKRSGSGMFLLVGTVLFLTEKVGDFVLSLQG